MMMLWYPKCSTCKRAKAWLEENNVVVQLRDIVQDNPTAEELKKWQEMSGLPLKRFFNTSGMKYRELDLKNRLSTMSVDEQFDLLATDGMLVKRPILVGDDFAYPGFREKEWKEFINI